MLVFTVSLTPAAMSAPDYPPTTTDSEDTNPGKNPVDEIKKATKDSSYYGTAKNENARTPYDNYKGGFDGAAEAESIKMWFCGNIPLGIHLKAQVHTAIYLMEEIPLTQLRLV